MEPDCRAHNARLFVDGLEGKKAWCSPYNTTSDDFYLEVDLKGRYYITAIVTQGLESGRVTKFKYVHPFHLSSAGVAFR